MIRVFLLALLLATSARAGTIEHRGMLTVQHAARYLASNDTVVIKQCGGGLTIVADWLKNKPIVVDGPCESACTWLFVTNARACFTPANLISGKRNEQHARGLVASVRPGLKPYAARTLATTVAVPVPHSALAMTYPDWRCPR